MGLQQHPAFYWWHEVHEPENKQSVMHSTRITSS